MLIRGITIYYLHCLENFRKKYWGKKGENTNQNISPFRFHGECLFLPGGRRKKDVSKVHTHQGDVRPILNCFLNGSQVFYSLHHYDPQERGGLKSMIGRPRTKCRGGLQHTGRGSKPKPFH